MSCLCKHKCMYVLQEERAVPNLAQLLNDAVGFAATMTVQVCGTCLLKQKVNFCPRRGTWVEYCLLQTRLRPLPRNNLPSWLFGCTFCGKNSAM